MIRGYISGDALLVLPQKEQEAEAVCFAKCFDELSGYSLIDDLTGDVLAVFAYQIENFSKRKVAWCYALFGKQSGKKMLEAVRFLKNQIPSEMKKSEVDCALMTVKKGFLSGKRLALKLGFEEKGLYRAFYEGKDYQVFERKGISCLGD